MKIGILTFHNADSYGAVLQAYALQETLAALGADSEFVQIQTSTPPQAPTVLPTPAAALFARRIQEAGKKREQLFTQFRDQYMRLSAVFQPSDDINNAYDCFIAGSDQIWNFRIPGADARYFLPFASAEKRYSYAASFGADALPEKAKPWVTEQLAKFIDISVREDSGRQIVKELIGRDATVCLDPTLLPDRNTWESLTDSPASTPYVLLFMLKYDDVLVQKAQAEAEKQQLPLRIITAAFMPQIGMEAWNGTGVTQWLSDIRYADCVFTNSFHGMVFSMIFGRPFHVEKLGGELSTRNGRLEELLSSLQLNEALIEVVYPDYEAVWEQLADRREDSLAYLRRIVRHDIVVRKEK